MRRTQLLQEIRIMRFEEAVFIVAKKQLGIEMIPACSPQARGRCERAFKTHQERLPKELAILLPAH